MFVSYLNFWLSPPRNGLSLISSWEATDCKEPPSWSTRFDKLQAEYTLLWRNKQMRLIKMPFSLGQKSSILNVQKVHHKISFSGGLVGMFESQFLCETVNFA